MFSKEDMIVMLKRSVSWIGSVDRINFEAVLRRFARLYQEDPEAPIYMLVCSQGGNTGIGLAFYDLVRSWPMKLVGVGAGDLDSMGLIIFLAAEERIIMPHAKLYLHQGFVSTDRPTTRTTSELRGLAEEGVTRDRFLAEIIAERSSGQIEAEEVLQVMQRETMWTAKRAVELGMAHRMAS